jgi:hypothetical protein
MVVSGPTRNPWPTITSATSAGPVGEDAAGVGVRGRMGYSYGIELTER